MGEANANRASVGEMLNINTILLPVDLPLASFSILHQAAILARHFHSDIVMLHVINEDTNAARRPVHQIELADGDLRAEAIREGREQGQRLDHALDGLHVQSRVVKGDTAREIMTASRMTRADLIMMPSHGFTFSQFLLGTAARRGAGPCECPVWTGPQVEPSSGHDFAIRSIVAAVEFGVRSELTASWAAQLATEFGARLTLANVTAGVELWGPGGNQVDPKWKEELVGNASDQMARLQQQTGIQAEVFIGSGEMGKVLSDAVKQAGADLLVTGCYPYAGHLRTHGYGIMCAVQVPVLSV